MLETETGEGSTMNLDELKEKIKPDIESIFGGSMAALILNKAKMKVDAERKSADDASKCKYFVECLGSDDKLVGMWGGLETSERSAKWMKYIQ